MDNRGVQLASLFMSGVDTALFVNDVCGQPLPWDHCCPWGFFDGKLFQSKLAKATRDRASLLDMCEGQVTNLKVQMELILFLAVVLQMNVSSLPAGGTGIKGGEDAPGHSGRHQPLPTASPTSTTATPCIPSPCHGAPFLPHAPSVPSSTPGLHATTTSSPPAPAQGLPRLDSPLIYLL